MHIESFIYRVKMTAIMILQILPVPAFCCDLGEITHMDLCMYGNLSERNVQILVENL